MKFYVAVYIGSYQDGEDRDKKQRGEWLKLSTVEDDPTGTARATVGEFLTKYMKENKHGNVHNSRDGQGL